MTSARATFFHYLGQRRLQLVIGIGCAAATALASVVPPCFIGAIIDSLQKGTTFETVVLLALGSVGFSAGEAIFRGIARYLLLNLARQAEYEMRNDLFAQGRDPVLASVPLLWDKRRTFVGLTRATPAHLSDLVANLTHFRERFTRALAGERLQGEANFATRYERVIASELERTERAIASIANDAASTASLSATPAAVTSPRAPS